MLTIASNVFDTVGRIAGHPTDGEVQAGPELFPRREVIHVTDLMRYTLSRSWRIEELADAVALSRSQLDRLFRSQMGVAPGAYLAQLRADQMAELLTMKDSNVAEAARAVGWRNPTVAARIFKRRYGIAAPRVCDSREALACCTSVVSRSSSAVWSGELGQCLLQSQVPHDTRNPSDQSLCRARRRCSRSPEGRDAASHAPGRQDCDVILGHAFFGRFYSKWNPNSPPSS